MNETSHSTINRFLIGLLVVLILLAGGYLRFVGINWDGDQHLHPDERFLTMVESSISPVESLAGYFDTGESSLNPNNRGHGFYVYGTLPLFLVRYVAEFVDQTGYGSVHIVGRALSATVDLLTVFMVYLIGSQLFNRRTGVLAAALSAFAGPGIILSPLWHGLGNGRCFEDQRHPGSNHPAGRHPPVLVETAPGVAQRTGFTVNLLCCRGRVDQFSFLPDISTLCLQRTGRIWHPA